MKSCQHNLMYLNFIKMDENRWYIVLCDRCMGWWRTDAGYAKIIPKITSARKSDGTPIQIDDLLKPEMELKGD